MKDNKLKPKETGTGNSISAVAALLRGEAPAQSSDKKEEVIISKEEGVVKVPEKEVDSTHTVVSKKTVLSENDKRENDTNSEFDFILESLKDRDYSCKSTLYVDDEVKEVFQMLKAKGKIPIANLVSYILEQWVLEHKSEITDVLSGKKNRFM